ncbi:MAG: uridine kinase [Planctomycetota bacterium]
MHSDSPATDHPFIVGIAGASGSGKSRFAERLKEHLVSERDAATVTVLSEDAYYRDRSDLSFEQRCLINYDHPDALEHELLVEQLRKLRKGEAVEVPEYDYSTHNRKSTTRWIAPCHIVLLEGILLLSDEAIRSQCDLKLFIDVPLDVCLSRRLRRDVLERGRSVESVLDQYEQTVRPMFHAFVEPSKVTADLVVPGGGENDLAARVLVQFLETQIRSIS